MTSSRVRHFPFRNDHVALLPGLDPRLANWPVVYTLNDTREVYVGESRNVAARMKQHRDSTAKQHLREARVIVHERFNKSACLDLESYLIRLFAGDGRYRVLNRNDGVTDADYFDREAYRTAFAEIVDELGAAGVFDHTVAEIENSDLFKLSPFKALTPDQAIALEDIVEGLLTDLGSDRETTSVVSGDPGTGKTVVAIYLLKLLRDIAAADPAGEVVTDSVFAEHFTADNAERLRGLRIALVVPQQSLRSTIEKVFAKTPGLHPSMVLTPFEVGDAEEQFDLLIVDETHRLTQRANQASGVLNRKYRDITERLFGADDVDRTQLDWIREKSRHRIFLLDSAQRVRPADLPTATLARLVEQTPRDRRFTLRSQMRVAGGADYVDHVRRMLAPRPDPDLARRTFPGYELALFEDLGALRARLAQRDSEHGLARLVAGYAWPWRSRRDPSAADIRIDGIELQWNRTATDWISSPGAVHEVGSVHTVQGYDLNYAGVIIGPDLRFDVGRGRMVFDRASYHDRKGKENNPVLQKVYTDEDLLELVCNIYAVLLTRGMRGTYVYACDPGMRAYLRRLLPLAAG